MSNKYTLKVIQQGQTQKIHALTQGAGMSGQALVIKAENGSRYQLTELVTQISPNKLLMKRVGQNLHVALPGGDLDAPDLVIEAYFAVDKASMWGSHETGEWMTYNTADLPDANVPGTPAGPLKSLFGNNNLVELSSPATTPTAKALTYVETPKGLGTVLLGAAGLALLANSLKSDKTSDPTPTGAEAVLKDYANDQSKTAPTLKDYSDFGIKAFASLSNTSSREDIDASSVLTDLKMNSSAWLAAINSAVVALGSSNVTKDKVQAAVDSYYRILREADGNPSVDTDVYQDPANDGLNSSEIDDPQERDYKNIGVTVGTTSKALDLLNDVVGRSATGLVDSVTELNAMARAAENVMLQAKAATSAASGGPALYTTDAEWAAGLGALGIVVSTSAIADIKEKIASTNDDGSEVDTQTDLREKLSEILAANTLRSYAVNGSGTAPALSVYKDAGIKALLNPNQTSATEDITSSGVANAMGGSETWQRALSSGLDKIDMGSATRLVDIKSKLQAMADSYYRILSEADGVVNTTPSNDDLVASDYSNIGAKVGTTLKALELLNDFVGLSNKAAVDTVAEIDEAARAAESIMLMVTGLTTGASGGPTVYGTNNSQWAEGLTKFGITGVTSSNIIAVKKAIEDSQDDGSKVATVKDLNDLLKRVIALQALKDYANANNGDSVVVPPTLTTYKDAGVKTLASLTEAAGAGTAEVDAGGVLAAMGSTWLQALNSALDKQLGNETLTVAKLRLMAESYYRILSEADGKVNAEANGNTDVNGGGDLANDDPAAIDYANIGAAVGATLQSLALLNDFVGLSAKTAVDTVAEIDAAARAAENIMLKAKGASAAAAGGPSVYASDAEWVDGLTALGITGVTSSNIAAIQQALDSSTDNTSGDGSVLDTVAEVQAQVSWVRLKTFTDDPQLLASKSAPTPTLSDWSAIGIKARDSLSDATVTQNLSDSNTNLNAINSALDRWAGTPHLQDLNVAKTTLQGVVDAYARLLAEADGSRTTDVNVYSASGQDPALQDYENLMGGTANLSTLTTGVDAKWLDLINDCIGGLSSSAVDTATEIEDLIKVSANVMKQAVGAGWSYTTNSEWIAALGTLGITGLDAMTDTQRGTVRTSIQNVNDSTEMDTWSELQGIVNLVRINEYAASNTNAAPSFGDYQAFFDYGTTGKADLPNASSVYTNAFNDAVNNKPGNSFTAAEVKALVNGYAAILAEANGTTLGDQQSYDPLAQDYLAVGVGLPVGVAIGREAAIRAMLGDLNNSGSIDGAESNSVFANLLSDVVANKNTSDVDTLVDLNALALVVTKIRELEAKPTGNTTYTDISGGPLTAAELASLGLSNTNQLTSGATLNAFYNGIIDDTTGPGAVSSLASLQDLIYRVI